MYKRARFIRVNGLVIILISIAGYSGLIYVENSAVSAWMSWIKPNICTHLQITPFHKAHKFEQV